MEITCDFCRSSEDQSQTGGGRGCGRRGRDSKRGRRRSPRWRHFSPTPSSGTLSLLIPPQTLEPQRPRAPHEQRTGVDAAWLGRLRHTKDTEGRGLPGSLPLPSSRGETHITYNLPFQPFLNVKSVVLGTVTLLCHLSPELFSTCRRSSVPMRH